MFTLLVMIGGLRRVPGEDWCVQNAAFDVSEAGTSDTSTPPELRQSTNRQGTGRVHI